MGSARITKHRASAAVLLAICLGQSLPCFAAPPEPTAVERAADEFDRAMERWQEGDKHLALKGFRASHALVPTDAALWNIIIAEHELNQPVDAHRDLDTYLRKYETHITPPRLKEAVELRRDLEGKLGRLHVSADALGVTVWIDGAKSETDAWLAPGDHVVRAEAPDRRPTEKTVTLDSGKTTAVELRLPVVSPPPDPTQRNLGFGLLAIGGAGVVAGGALAVKALSTKSPSQNTGTASPEGPDYGRASQVTLTMGALALAIGTHLVVTAPSSHRAPPAPGVRVSLAAAPVDGGALGLLRGTF